MGAKGKGERIGRRAIWAANGAVGIFLLIVILLVVAVGGYTMWDAGKVDYGAAAARYAEYKPDVNNALSFEQLVAINPEVIAWLTVYGTHIDYPVTQAKDNVKYINTDAKGNFALSGSIFLDAGNHPDFSDFNSILYGHHMAGQVMFGEIPLFADKNYFAARKYGMLHYGGKDYGLEFFAFIHDNAYDNSLFNVKIADSKSRQAYLSQIVKKAVQFRPDVPVSADDRIVLLSTCSSDATTNGRDILVGKVTAQTYPDAFKTTAADKANTIPVVGALPGFWASLPLWTKIGVFLLMIPLILLALFLIRKKKRHPRKNNNAQSGGSTQQT